MVKRVIALIALLLILTLPIVADNKPEEVLATYHFYVNLFEKSFTEPCESILFILDNGDCLGYTQYLENKVWVPVDSVTQELKKSGRTWESVIYVIHNHFMSTHFGEEDMKLFHILRRLGFRGKFALWHVPSKKVVRCLDAGENNEDKKKLPH